MKIESSKPVSRAQDQQPTAPKSTGAIKFYDFLRALIAPYSQVQSNSGSSSPTAQSKGQSLMLGAAEQSLLGEFQSITEEKDRLLQPSNHESSGLSAAIGVPAAPTPPSGSLQPARRDHASAVGPIKSLLGIELPSGHAETAPSIGHLSQLTESALAAPQQGPAGPAKGTGLTETTDTTVPTLAQVIGLPGTTECVIPPMVSSASNNVSLAESWVTATGSAADQPVTDVKVTFPATERGVQPTTSATVPTSADVKIVFPLTEGRVQATGSAAAERVTEVKVTFPATERGVQPTTSATVPTSADVKIVFPVTQGRTQATGSTLAQGRANVVQGYETPEVSSAVVTRAQGAGLTGESAATTQGTADAEAAPMVRSSAPPAARPIAQPGETAPAFTGVRISPPAPITEASLAALRMEVISFVQNPSRPQVTLEIHPPEYGRVLVSAELGQERGVTVRLVVENNVVREQMLVHLQRFPLPADIEVMTFEEYREQGEAYSRHKREQPKHQSSPQPRDESATEFKV